MKVADCQTSPLSHLQPFFDIPSQEALDASLTPYLALHALDTIFRLGASEAAVSELDNMARPASGSGQGDRSLQTMAARDLAVRVGMRLVWIATGWAPQATVPA